MKYQASFGTAPARKAVVPGSKFRLALLGDFSGRANAGRLEIGAALAGRKPIRVDVDTLDDVLARFRLSLELRLDEDAAPVRVTLGSMDDFHPDQLAENVALFEELPSLRGSLKSRTGFDRAAREVLS